jgi:hypothetical protein
MPKNKHSCYSYCVENQQCTWFDTSKDLMTDKEYQLFTDIFSSNKLAVLYCKSNKWHEISPALYRLYNTCPLTIKYKI